MPDVFEKFFNRFDKKIDDYFQIEKLDPGFQIINRDLNEMKISSKWNEILKLFEKYEEGKPVSLEKFMDEISLSTILVLMTLSTNPECQFLNFSNQILLKIYLNFKYFHHIEIT